MTNTKKLRKSSHSARTFKKSVCSPTKGNNSYTCYSSEGLHKLKSLWNKRHPDVKITSNKDHEIWSQLKENMHDTCSTEQCWLRKQFIKNNIGVDLVSYTFAPAAPQTWKANPNQWLNSLDIDRVMRQYEKKFSHFVFIGPTPIDFDKKLQYDECVWEELCKFNLEKIIKKGKTMIGVIFNVDPHNKPGAHWISLFIDIKQQYMLFFDSTGDPPQGEIVKLMDRITEQGEKLNIRFERYINKQNHQLQDTECGIYSIYILTELLQKKKTKEYFLTGRIPDEEMFKLRKKYFNLDNGSS